MKRLVWLAMAVVLTGCAERTYEARWGQDTDQFKQDYYRCVRESQQPWSTRGLWVLGLGPLGIPVIQVRETQLYDMCMDAAGWNVVKEQKADAQ